MPVLARAGRRRGTSLARLLDAVESLLHEGGSYSDLTVAQITERAGVARSSFYLHFGDRRELLLRLVEDRSTPLLARLSEVSHSELSPDPERLRDELARTLSLARQNAGAFRALIEATAYDRDVARAWQELNQRFIAALATRLTTQQEGGRGSPLPAHAAALALVSMVAESVLRQVSQQTGVSDAELVEALASIWERAAYNG